MAIVYQHPLPCHNYLFARFEICVMATLHKQQITNLSHLFFAKKLLWVKQDKSPKNQKPQQGHNYLSVII